MLSRFAAADSMLSDYGHYFAASLSEVKDLAVKGADAETLDALMRKTFEDIKNKKAPGLRKSDRRGQGRRGNEAACRD